MNEEIEMDLDDKNSVLDALAKLINCNEEKEMKEKDIVVKIKYKNASSTRSIEVYLRYQSLYVFGVGNSHNNLSNNKPFVLPNPSYQNEAMYPLPGIMTKEAIIHLLDSIDQADNICDILVSKTSKKYENNIIMLIYIVSEAARSELCKKVALDVLFNQSSKSYVINTSLSNWTYSQHFLVNWKAICMKYARGNFKEPIGICHIVSYCLDLLQSNPQLGEQVRDSAIKLGVPLVNE